MVKNLKKLRTEKGISQQTLADSIGISQQSINKYENHKIEPEILTLIAIADYFDTTVDYLIGRTDENGKRLLQTYSDVFIEKYTLLSDNEKECVNALADTFLRQKNNAKSPL